MGKPRNPVNSVRKTNTREAVEHVVGLLCRTDHEEFAANLLDFLPTDTLTADEEQAIRDEYNLED